MRPLLQKTLGPAASLMSDQKPPPTPHQASSKIHVLVVDQNLSSRMELRMALHGAGFHVAACASGAAARQALKIGGYHLAIIDNVLPDGNVQELLREIRFHERDARLPIILLAQNGEKVDRARAAKLSVDDILPKPCDMVALLRLANKLVHASRTLKAQEPATAAGQALRKLMVAHADPVVRRSLFEAFRADGVNVLIATSTDDSYSLLADERVDAIIVDYLLPPLGCLDLCRAIRKNAVQKHVPVFVMVSPGDDPDAFRKAKAAGADELLIKTADMGVLRAHIREVMHRLKRERSHFDGAFESLRDGENSRPPSSRDPLEDSGARPTMAGLRAPADSRPGHLSNPQKAGGSVPPPSSRRSRDSSPGAGARTALGTKNRTETPFKSPRVIGAWPEEPKPRAIESSPKSEASKTLAGRIKK